MDQVKFLPHVHFPRDFLGDAHPYFLFSSLGATNCPPGRQELLFVARRKRKKEEKEQGAA
jgi:hypothetical protein